MSSITWLLNETGTSQFIVTIGSYQVFAQLWREGLMIEERSFLFPSEPELEGPLAVSCALGTMKSMNYDELTALADALNVKFTRLTKAIRGLEIAVERAAEEVVAALNSEPNNLGILAFELKNMLPDLKGKYYTCPQCDQELTLFDMIMHLNDDHQKTREEIADWLETLDADLTFKVTT